MVASRLQRGCLFAVWLLTASVVPGCGMSTASVDVHGVNYRGDEFSYFLIDPDDPHRISAGERIDPFAAGGTTCCYRLPKHWRPGIKMQIRTSHRQPEDKDGKLPEVKESHIAEVPPYVDGKPGELWVVRGADGKISVVSSDFQPDHPKWPGKLKGWPVPSLEYRRERWEIFRQRQEAFVHAYLALLEQLEKSPTSHAREAWADAAKYERSSLAGFSGPDDPRYVQALRTSYLKELEESREELKKIMESRP